MAFGAFSPLPLRLGGSSEEGWTAAQHARLAADLVAVVRAAPLAVVTVTMSGSTYTVDRYHGQNGVGRAHAPSIANASLTTARLTWAKSYRTERYLQGVREGEDRPWVVRQAQAWNIGPNYDFLTTAWVESDGTVRVALNGAQSAVVEIWGDWLPLPQIGTYGGDPNKEDSATEGDVPYAAVIYQDLQGARGSAYTQNRTSLVHAENLALARFWGYFSYRLPEKVRANAVPSRSDEGLDYWARVLGVHSQPDDERWLLRQRASVAYRVSTGPTYAVVQDALRELLGDAYVTTHVQDELPLSTPPSPTLWPGVNPGSADYDIGGGAWYSRRSHLVIQVQQLPGQSRDDFLRLVNVDMFILLDRLLPAHVTFSWNTGGSFIIGSSLLGFDGVS